jgi:nicotinamide-nucleotide amidase
MNAEILCIGTELLLGDVVNSNAAYIARGLAACGVGCYYQSVVGDNPDRLKEGLKLALSRADVVITTGGLGPTYDDLTKETVAEYFGREMLMHEPSLEHLSNLFTRMNRPMTDNNRKQAMMPEGAIVFHNDRGTANGLAVEGGGKVVIMLPGPPREMTAMFDNCVHPYLMKRSDMVLVSHNIHFFGIGESALETELREFMLGYDNPTIAPYAKEGEVLLRVTASAKDEKSAEELIKPVVDEICGRFPQLVYGVDADSLQNALVRELAAAGLTIATAESCTGGQVSGRITSIPGSSAVFGCGLCTYSNDAKIKLLGVKRETLGAHGAVSPETAAEMAEGVRGLAQSDIGIAVTGIAGPQGGTEEKPVGLVFVGVASRLGTRAVELRLSRRYGGERSHIQLLASSNALYQALREAQNL